MSAILLKVIHLYKINERRTVRIKEGIGKIPRKEQWAVSLTEKKRFWWWDAMKMSKNRF